MSQSSPLPAFQPDLANVLERITDGFFALDAQWNIVYMNAEARRMLHAPPVSEILGKQWLETFPMARGTAFEREYARAMRDQVPVSFVEWSRTSNCWFEVKAYPSPDGISVYFRDVTTRVEAERELERRSSQQEALIELSRAALTERPIEQLFDEVVEMLVVYLGAAAVELYTYDERTRMFRLRSSDGWGEKADARAVLPYASQAAAAIAAGGTIQTVDVRLDERFVDRGLFAELGLRAAACTLIGTPEVPQGLLAAYLTGDRAFGTADLHFLEAVAATLGEAMRAAQSSRQTREILESITDAFVACDRDLRVTYVNERMAAFYGRKREEIVGTNVREYLGYPGGEHVVAAFRSALDDDRPATFETQTPNRRWYEGRVYPWMNGVACYIRDVTRRKLDDLRIRELNTELERRVRERTLQLEAANKELESFAYSVSHDLRAPLRAIDGFSQVLEEDFGDQLNETARGYLGRIRAAARRMAELIDALLQLARIARHSMSFQDVDLSALAASVCEDLRESDPRDVIVEIEPGLRASGEPALLRAALQNLIGNAWKFTRKTPAPLIRVGRTSEGEFFVSDNGAGFDMAYAGKLFGAFQRLHSADEFEGTGIGLATVARIIHRHGGIIRAEGEVGKGATFYFTLPEETRAAS